MKKTERKIIKGVFRLVVSAILIVMLFFGAVSLMKTLYPLDYAKYVEASSQKYGLEKSFVYAVIECESGFDKDAVSSVGARGLMQIMPETFEWLLTKTEDALDEEDLFDPEISVKYGCLLYSILLSEFSSEETAVAAYHAGIGNVRQWLSDEEYSSDGKTLKSIPFPSTEKYVEKVMKVKNIYEKLYNM